MGSALGIHDQLSKLSEVFQKTTVSSCKNVKSKQYWPTPETKFRCIKYRNFT